MRDFERVLDLLPKGHVLDGELSRFDVREAVALGEDRPIARHHDDHCARTFVVDDPLLHQRIDDAGEIGLCQSKWRLWCFGIRDGGERDHVKDD
jgi:hypothetical protein